MKKLNAKAVDGNIVSKKEALKSKCGKTYTGNDEGVTGRKSQDQSARGQKLAARVKSAKHLATWIKKLLVYSLNENVFCLQE